MNREEELKLFKKVCSEKKVVTNNHTNFMNRNTRQTGNFNQGVSKAKFREFIKQEGEKIDKIFRV